LQEFKRRPSLGDSPSRNSITSRRERLEVSPENALSFQEEASRMM
jgi:hypothetical protein